VLTQESLVDTHDLHRQGCNIQSFAKQLGISRNTVRRYLRDIAQSSRYGPRKARASKLGLFKPYLRARIDAAKPYWIPEAVLCR
jgi:transposase